MSNSSGSTFTVGISTRAMRGHRRRANQVNIG
jgi:hypothetical protein